MSSEGDSPETMRVPSGLKATLNTALKRDIPVDAGKISRVIEPASSFLVLHAEPALADDREQRAAGSHLLLE
jgi:hypothetical protein